MPESKKPKACFKRQAKPKPKTREQLFRAALGRPSKYSPEMPDRLIEHMRQGNMFETFGAVVRVASSTLYKWVDDYPAFSEAKEVGNELSLQWWENVGKMGATGQLKVEVEETLESRGTSVTKRKKIPATFGQSAWIFLMKNRFQWRDNRQLELTGKGGGPVKTEDVSKSAVDRLKDVLSDEGLDEEQAEPKDQ